MEYEIIEDDIPPAKTTTTKPRAKTTGTAKTSGSVPWSEIEDSLTAVYIMAGGFLQFTPQVPERVRPIGAALQANTDQCVAAWIEAAKKNPKLAKALTRFAMGSAYGGIVTAHLPILFAIYAAANPPAVNGTDQDAEPDAPPATVFRMPV